MSDVQREWRWCNKCQGMFFSGNTLPNYCPAGGGHSYDQSQNYGLLQGHQTSGVWKENWRWCAKCQGLFWSGDQNNEVGRCSDASVSTGHDAAGSGDYTVSLGPLLWATKSFFRYCVRCAGLWNINNSSTGYCPAGGGHSSEGSGEFYV